MTQDDLGKGSVFDNECQDTQPSVDMVLVPRGDIEKVRMALLCLCASEARGGKGLRVDAERQFFLAHKRLTELLTVRTDPSAKSTLTTPGCRLPAVCAPALSVFLTEQLHVLGGMTWL